MMIKKYPVLVYVSQPFSQWRCGLNDLWKLLLNVVQTFGIKFIWFEEGGFVALCREDSSW